MRLLARLARLESRSPVTSLLSVVGVVMVLFTPVQRTVKARSDRLSDRRLTVVILSKNVIKVIIRYKGARK